MCVCVCVCVCVLPGGSVVEEGNERDKEIGDFLVLFISSVLIGAVTGERYTHPHLVV